MFFLALALSFVFGLLAVYIINRSYVNGIKEAQETIIESLSDGIAGVTADHKIVMANSAFQKISGAEKDKLVNQPIDSVLKIYREETVVLYETYSKQNDPEALTGLKLHTAQGEIPLSLTFAPYVF